MKNSLITNYNYNPSLNIPVDRIKPVNSPNKKLNDQYKGKGMVQCISALSQANGRCKQQLRINYLKGIIEQKIYNEKYHHLSTISGNANTYQTIQKQALVPSQYLQTQRLNNAINSQQNIIKTNQAQNISNLSYQNLNNGSFQKNIPNNNPFRTSTTPLNQTNPALSYNNQFKNYNPTNNQQINQIGINQNMKDQKSNLQNLPTLQRGATFGPVNAFNNQSINVTNHTIQQPFPLGQQNNPMQNLMGNNYSNQNTSNPMNVIQSNLLGNSPNSNFIPSNFNNNTNNTNQTSFQSFHPTQNQGFNSNQNLGTNQNKVQFNNKTNLNSNLMKPGNFSQQTKQYMSKYPILYKIKQEQLNKLKQANIKQHNFSIQSLTKHLKDIQQNKYNIWNQVALNKYQMGPNNEQGRRYITHIFKRMIDQKMIDDKVLKESIAVLYKFIYGQGVFNQMMNQYKNKSDTKNSTAKNNPFLDLLEGQQKNIRLDEIMGKDINQSNFSNGKKFKSLQDFDQQILYKKREIKNNLQSDFYQEETQQKQRQFSVVYVEKKNSTNKIKESVSQLQQIGEIIKHNRYQTFKSIKVDFDELPNIQNFSITPSLSQLSRMLKSEIKSVSHVKIQNQWGYLQFLVPISLFKKNIQQCVFLGQNQVFIFDKQWQVRQCRVTFKRFANFSEMNEQDRYDLQIKIKKWCKEQKIQLIQIDQIEGKVTIQL